MLQWSTVSPWRQEVSYVCATKVCNWKYLCIVNETGKKKNMWLWVVLYCLYASIGACSLSVCVLKPLLFVPHVLLQVVALHWRFEIVSIGWIRARITCFNLTVSILAYKREFPINKIALVNVIGQKSRKIWKSCVFQNGRHISASFRVVELFF